MCAFFHARLGGKMRGDVLIEAVAAYKRHNHNKTLAAKSLGLSRSTFRNRLDKALSLGLDVCDDDGRQIREPKILFYDLELSGSLAFLFQSGKQYVNPANIFFHQFIISIHWKWSDDGGVQNFSVLDNPEGEFYHNDIHVARKAIELFEQADIVVAHNGNRFDKKHVFGAAQRHRLPPFREPLYIDTLNDARRAKYDSNKLGELCKRLDLKQKKRETRIDWWHKATIFGCKESISKIVHYGDGDIETLEELYYLQRPYNARFHPNLNLILGTNDRCPACGSSNIELQDRPKIKGKTSIVDEYRCKSCGAYSNSGRNQRKGDIIR